MKLILYRFLPVAVHVALLLWPAPSPADEPDVLGPLEILRLVGACAIEHHENELLRMGGADLRQEEGHLFGVTAVRFRIQ